MLSDFSNGCQPTDEEFDTSREGRASFGARDGGLEVLGQLPILVQTSEGSLNDPSEGEDLESFCGLGALDNLERTAPEPADGGLEFVAHISAIAKTYRKRQLNSDSLPYSNLLSAPPAEILI